MPLPVSEPLAQLALILPCYCPPPHLAENVLASPTRLQNFLPEAATLHLYVVNDDFEKEIGAVDLALFRHALPNRFSYLSHAGTQGKGYALRTGEKPQLRAHFVPKLISVTGL
ncbi:hypothetical protein GCM10027346_32670 [Hymenobacter seoulensis]